MADISARLAGVVQNVYFVEKYGAVADGPRADGASTASATNSAPPIQAAIDAASAAGGGVVLLGEGVYVVNSTLLLKPNVTLRGAGIDMTVIKAGTDAISVIGRHTSSQATNSTTVAAGSIVLCDLTVVGYGDRNQVQHNNGQRAVWLGPAYEIRVENVRVKYSRHFSLSLTSHFGLIENCEISKSYRDGINSGTCHNLQVISTKFKHVGDDALAWHTPSGFNGIIQRSLLVQGCRFEYCFGIHCLGGQNVNIDNNEFRFVYGYAAKFAQDSGYSEGYSTSFNIDVGHNTVENIILPTVVGFSSTMCSAFVINQSRSLGANNTQIAAHIGTYDSVAGAFVTGGKVSSMKNAAGGGGSVVVATDPYHYTAGSTDTPLGPAFGINIHDNTVLQTLDPAATWSTYGFDAYDSAGRLWSTNGFKLADLTTDNNPAFTNGFVRVGNGVRLQGYLDAVKIADNTFVGVDSGVQMASLSWLRGSRICDNIIFRAKNGINISAVNSTSHIAIDCIVENNSIDIDPYFEAPAGSGGRTSPLDGTWQSAGSNYHAIVLNWVHGLVATRNSVRNCNKVIHLNSADCASYDNLCFWDWSSGNKGIGSFSGAQERAQKHFFVYSDPTNALYGKTFSPDSGTTFVADSASVLAASAMPTQGYFRSGQFVAASGTLTVSAGKVLIGWRRITNGNAHVSGTDWNPVTEYSA